ncbi:hypothetical protein BST11_09965 [Mycobacterium alsense]|uniref:DUF4352 domain-containing protein n=1 Tax=Mycobacterium alsense TaxID=324058 RepID=A0AA41XPD5_9MYCO|nr:DUF4352 domain-containing protein [Mycobacterium alsense]OQZ91151.1 hypothetical protein BST11_09965 [Mycobacterium alsense]
MGQPAIDDDFVFLLTSVDRSEVVGNPTNPCGPTTAKSVFVNARLTVTNTGAEPRVFSAADQKLMVDGVAFKVANGAALSGAATSQVTVVPGARLSVVLSFEVPAETPAWGALELHASSTSPGVGVAFPSPHQSESSFARDGAWSALGRAFPGVTASSRTGFAD